MIKAVIFDYGGVVSRKGSLKEFGDIYAKRFGKDPKKLYKIMIESWNLAIIGKSSSLDFWKNMSSFLGVNPERVRRDIIRFMGFRKETLFLAKKLKARYKIGLLSNFIEDWFEELLAEQKLNEIFDAIVVSYKIGAAKPDRKMYKEVASKLGVSPKECVFIDNFEENTISAAEFGMKTILFKSLGQLKSELRALGLEF